MAAGGKRRSFYADLDHMRSLFDSVDTNETGYIGFKELCILVRSIPGIEEAAVPELMERLDRDRDGKVTFDDFEVLFAQEREEIKKKRKLNPSTGTLSQTLSDSDTSPHHHNLESGSEQDLSQSFEYNTALEQLPSIQEISVSPKSTSPRSLSSLKRGDNGSSTIPESPTVILRHKVSRRATLPAKFDEAEHFSPIHATRQKRPPSNELPDLATQMRYLTDISCSPQLKRGSKVLSWISESGEVFDLEGTGQLYIPDREMSGSDGLPSPPLSPMRGGDETSNFKTILESVCHTDKIGKEAISQLCKHVKADSQEESELLTLLSHLDKDRVGYVSLDEFVHGLQFIRSAAVVTSTPPTNKTSSLRRAHSEIIPPLHFGTPISTHPPFLASTPLPAGATYTTDTSALLTVLDPDHSGIVKVDNLISQWQQMGVEAPHDTSLEDALSEAVSIDPAGRVNVSELATSLEGALLSEENKANVLRQVALKLYKTEISALKTKVHHVSLERDTLRSSLNRTLEENKRLVKEGDEHADLVQQQSEQKLKETEAQLTDLLSKEKRSREEEARQMQESAATMIKDMEKKLQAMRGEVEVLRQNLKLQQDECNFVTNELQKANRTLDQKDRTIQMLQRDLGYRSELDIGVDETHLSRLRELEDVVVERDELVTDLREGMTEMQDKYDLLVAENEKLKQKYLSQKRSLFRRSSTSPEDVAKVEKRHSIGDRPARPLSGSLFGRNRRLKPRQPSISYKLDLATEGSHHPILWEEEKFRAQENSGSSEEMEEAEPEQPVKQYKDEEEELEEAISKPMSEESTPDEDDFFARSTTSLMQELLIEEEKNMLENKIEQLRKEKAQLVHNYEQLEQQMKTKEASHKDDLYHQCEQSKHKQRELEEYIAVLEKLRQNILANQTEMDCQIKDEMPKQLPKFKAFQSNLDDNMRILIDELDHSKHQLEEERNAHAEAVSSLKQQLAKLEEYSDLQTDQCLKLEEERARAEEEMAMLLNSRRKLSEARVNDLMLKLENLEKSRAEFEIETEEQLKEMQAELSDAYEKLKEFKEKSSILEGQLKDAREGLLNTADIKSEIVVSKEVVSVESSHPNLSVEALKLSLEKLEIEYAEVSRLSEQLQKDNDKMCATEKRMVAEILDLQKQLSAVEKELNDQSEVYTNEIIRLKEDMESEKERSLEKTAIQLEAMHSSLMKQMDESVQKYELKLETIKQELKVSRHREKSLQEKLIESGVQYEKLVSKVADLTQSEAKWQERAIDLERSQSQYLSEVSQLKADIQKYLAEISHLQTKEIWYNEKISSLQKVLEQRTSFEEEVDIVPALAAHSPNHFLYKPDSEAQGKLITQMKSRLEELQRLLLKSSQNDSSEAPNAELGLIQELLANNIDLDSAAKRMRRDFEAKNQELSEFLARKDSQLKNFRLEMDKEQKALEAVTASNTHQLLNRMDAFHGNSNKSLDKYRARIEAAAAMLDSIRRLVHDQDQRHINALESALDDLDQSQSEVCSYKDEVEKLRAQLDQSHHDAKQKKPTSNGLRIAIETSPSPGPSKRRVDEGSGQLIDNSSEMDYAQSRQNLLQQKDDEIKTLRDELDHVKMMEKRTRTMIDELEQDLVERKHEFLCKTAELQQKEIIIKELESKLNAVVGEPIEASAQYEEKQPLEGLKETVPTEVKDERLEVDSNSTLDEAKELLELRQALKTIEAELMESRQTEETLKLRHEANIEELIVKHAAELSATQNEIQSNVQEVQGLYLSLIDEDSSQDTASDLDGLTHSQFVMESRNIVDSLKQQLKQEQIKSSELESTLLSKLEEHDQLDAQFQAEHEEEVRALRQQKQLLIRQIEELKSHYQQSINEQDKQNSILLQDLANSKDDMEKQLQEKTEETYHVYQQVADLMEEKKVLMDIVHQLCVEAGRQIDVV